MSAHVRSQVLRFVRVSVLAFAASLPADGGRVSWSSLWALAAGAAETGLRQLLPVKPLPAVASVPVMSAEPPQAPPGPGPVPGLKP